MDTVFETKNELLLRELTEIEERDGVLKPEAVVEFAKNENTELHSHFTWDDGEAAKQHRLWQARQIIRVVVTTVKGKEGEVTTKAFVNFAPSEKYGGGYRSIVSVLSNSELKTRMLQDAMKELAIFRKKYAELKELTSIFDAIDKLT